ncbi:glycosyltransferase family 39 protein [Tunturiibacter empetritectus]|uniref:4-amino-4-deoxy-L-arabinose transferase-like glycosyltransferase n=1 Tax=Tunturiibacter lichenicola TaxID=2051959 RepID=A0A852VJJ8_9BACT|nr:glycosyltransferase family 39 protein [Edaphobacter lichenicola]NYF91917.1 4-amino-4-deoxy-L-arabinose transferase-like glycosyltransferase [Edaphobacter lichenicola]
MQTTSTSSLSLTTMSPLAKNRLILFVLWLLFYATLTLFVPPLLDDADSVHAEVAREMLLRHDWVTLYANGIRYLEKAPILYWSMALSFKLFGVNTAAARLPIALTVLSLALLLEAFARRAFSPRAGLYAGLMLLSSFGIFIFTRILLPDADLCLWLTLALFFYWATEQTHERQPDQRQTDQRQTQGAPQNRVPHLREAKVGIHEANRTPTPSTEVDASITLCWLFAASCALNVLTKGLIGIVFPLLIVLAHLILTRRSLGAALTRIRQLHPLSSTIVFLAIAAPWHILIALANPTQGHPGALTFAHGHWSVPLPTDGNVHGWLWFYFVNEQLLRYLNLRVPRDYDTVPLPLFWGLILLWIMPWSAFLFRSLAAVPWRKALRPRVSIRTLTQRENTYLLLGLWAIIPVLFFSLSTRQEYYVLPALPAMILLIAAWLDREATEAESFAVPSPLVASGQRISVVLLVLGSLAALIAGFFLLHSAPPNPVIDLASLLKQNPGDYALSFGHFLDLNAQAMGAFHDPLLLTAIALFTGTLANWLLRRAYQPHAANLCLAAATFGFVLAAHVGLQIFFPVLSSRQLATAIEPELKPSDLIVIHGEYESASTLGFYLGRSDLHILDGRSSNLWYGSFFPDAPPIFEDALSLKVRWLEPRRIFLWQSLSDPVPSLPGKTFFIAQSGGKEILSNQPNPY